MEHFFTCQWQAASRTVVKTSVLLAAGACGTKYVNSNAALLILPVICKLAETTGTIHMTLKAFFHTAMRRKHVNEVFQRPEALIFESSWRKKQSSSTRRGQWASKTATSEHVVINKIHAHAGEASNVSCVFSKIPNDRVSDKKPVADSSSGWLQECPLRHQF